MGLLETYMEAVTRAFSKWNELHDECETRFPIDPSNEQGAESQSEYDVERLDMEKRYIKLVGNIKDKINLCKPAVEQVRAQPVSRANNSIRLPEVKLPVFDSTTKGYLKFNRSFKELIESREDLDDIAKLQYLQGCCQSGLASQLVSSASDYQTAISRLEEHYSVEAQLKQQLVNEIYELKLEKHNDPDSLQAFIENLESSFAYLNSININYVEWGAFFVHHLQNQLDVTTRQEVERLRDPKVELTVPSLIQLLKRRLQLLRSSAKLNTKFEPKFTSTPKPNQKYTGTKPKNSFVAASSNAQPNQPVAAQKIRRCPLCTADHPVFECEQVKNSSIDQLKERIKTNKLCFNCLRKGHGVKDCHARGCQICNRKHHTLFHPKSEPQTPVKSKSETREIDSSKSNTSASALNSLKGHVVLATALVSVEDAQGQKIPARAFLDSGSSVHFMTNQLCHMLGIKKNRTNVTISGVNAIETKNNYMTTTTVYSRTSEYKANLEFLLTRKIVNKLPQESLNTKDLKFSDGCKLADPYFEVPGQVDLLLGAEIFFNIFTGTKVEISNELFLCPTLFGDIVVGRSIKSP